MFVLSCRCVCVRVRVCSHPPCDFLISFVAKARCPCWKLGKSAVTSLILNSCPSDFQPNVFSPWPPSTSYTPGIYFKNKTKQRLMFKVHRTHSGDFGAFRTPQRFQFRLSSGSVLTGFIHTMSQSRLTQDVCNTSRRTCYTLTSGRQHSRRRRALLSGDLMFR